MNLIADELCPCCHGFIQYVSFDYALFNHLCRLRGISNKWDRIDETRRLKYMNKKIRELGNDRQS